MSFIDNLRKIYINIFFNKNSTKLLKNLLSDFIESLIENYNRIDLITLQLLELKITIHYDCIS